ncbi:MAG TPA: hypothetical protein VN702_15870 [Acetobacteraceae bacterium]|nr:hypothetical protein [Acetobacteraceae bacterium]
MNTAEQVSRLAQRWLERRHRRRAEATLAAMDPRLLADIGYPAISDMQPRQRRSQSPAME